MESKLIKSMAIKNTKQNWSVGEKVNIGFMRDLEVVSVRAEKDGMPDIYTLESSKGKKYELSYITAYTPFNPMHLKNKSNEYAAVLGSTFDAIPKTVLAAIVISFAMRIEPDLHDSEFENFIFKEWQVLHQNGIVPQKPK